MWIYILWNLKNLISHKKRKSYVKINTHMYNFTLPCKLFYNVTLMKIISALIKQNIFLTNYYK